MGLGFLISKWELDHFQVLSTEGTYIGQKDKKSTLISKYHLLCENKEAETRLYD